MQGCSRYLGKMYCTSSHSFRVVESKNSGHAVGDLVVAHFGWCSHTIANGDTVLRKLDSTIALSPSTALGILGMPG